MLQGVQWKTAEVLLPHQSDSGAEGRASILKQADLLMMTVLKVAECFAGFSSQPKAAAQGLVIDLDEEPDADDCVGEKWDLYAVKDGVKTTLLKAPCRPRSAQGLCQL